MCGCTRGLRRPRFGRTREGRPPSGFGPGHIRARDKPRGVAEIPTQAGVRRSVAPWPPSGEGL
eukprot:14699183-Alexandrium_andersonii.AAC.1